MKDVSNHHLRQPRHKGDRMYRASALAGFVKDKKTYPDLSNFREGKLVQKDIVTSLGNLISDPPSYEFLYISKHGNVWVPGICQLDCSDILLDESWI